MPSIVAGRGQVALGAEELECVAQLLQSRFGFRLAEIQERNLKEAVRERMRRLGCAHGTDYVCELLGSPADGGELGELVSEYTNTETHFFRHRGRFELLCARVVPAVVERKRRSGGPIRVLSAGCSTGDEVYSIVMSLWPLRPAWCELGLEVVGCDINERALAKARQACYGSWPLRFTPSQVKAELFVPRPASTRSSAAM
ncbi:MAG: hypothetical protein HY744_18340 [Deltaproteobacteria bacterium]|nr:hypothetical protein [Deltaproteobacteria bacterium]